METRAINDYYRQLAEKVISENEELKYISDSKVKIIYLESDKEKKNKDKVVYGECEKVQSKNKWAIHADFTITLFKDAEELPEEKLKILLFHELLHVGIYDDGMNENYSIIPHDLEDFKIVIDKFGTDWIERGEK